MKLAAARFIRHAGLSTPVTEDADGKFGRIRRAIEELEEEYNEVVRALAVNGRED